MINITLMDGKVRSFDAPLSVLDLAKSISPSLAKKSLAGKVIRNGVQKMVDLHYMLTSDAQVALITPQDKEALDLVRHSTAHLLAQAVKELFPDVKLTIGPAIENGFYYDFSYKRPFTPEDLETIEARMREILKRNETVTREEWPRPKALQYFNAIHEDYKVELINDLPDDETISVYQQGEWIELCRGPHVPNVNYCKVFKLMHVAGAYWRGNSDNEMLQRIYGTAWFTQEEQDAYLKMLEEAELRDHRRLGKELDLFHLQEEGPGLIFWHPRGWAIWQQVEQYIRRIYVENGYQEVKAPQILDLSLWKKTGHWDNYKENMFITESENRVYGLKPMNCPGHIQIFNSGLHSYRELPLRYGEFGQCHRNEPSGSLHGIMRVRGFTQDDGHIFCTEDQLQSECANFTQLLQKVYRDFGFTEVLYKVATRPEKRIGSDEVWDKAEEALMASLKLSGCEFEVSPGEGAFYGPKIEYTLKDAIGRHWQCGTIQVDFSMPQRLGAEYVDSDDQRKTPVMLHRAILGSLERFIGVLIENYAGALPVWLSPEQVAVCTIAESFSEYATEIVDRLRSLGFRAVLDCRNEKITRKIRENMMRKIPYVLVIGEKEVESGTVSIRARGNLNLGVVSVDEFIARLTDDVKYHRETIIN